MSRPIRKQSHSAATAAGAGESHAAKAHNSLGIFVVAANLDTANDTLDVRLEAEGPDGVWSPIKNESGTQVGALSVSDFVDVNGDGTYTAMLYVHGVPAPSIRANITALTDSATGTSSTDLDVDTYVMAANNGGTGHQYDTV